VASNFLDQNDEELSIYGQFEYDTSNKTTLTLGLRYTDNEKEAASLFGVSLMPVAQYPPTETFVSSALVRGLLADAPETCPPGVRGTDRNGRPIGGPPPCVLPMIQPRIDETEWTGKLGLDHRPAESTMVYGHYSRGFKSGGFDTRALTALIGDANRPVGKETLDAFEVGLKSDLAGGSLQLDLAAFYYQWDDLQTFAVIAGIPGFFNIPESELYGLEAEVRWAPSESWYIQGSLGLLHTEITDAGEISGVDEGHELTNAPEITFNGLIARDWTLASGKLTLQTDFRYVDEQLDSLQDTTDDFATKDDNFFVNVRGIYVFGNRAQYQLAVWGENLTDETFCNDLGPLDDPFTPAPDDLTSTNICSPNDGEARYGITATVSF
jgi:iron complex outermembrane receptor protein